MSPENLTWSHLLAGGSVDFRVTIPNAAPGSNVKAEATCSRPDGSRQAAIGRVVGNRGLLRMPVCITAPGVYRFEWALTGQAGERLTGGSRELTLTPYVNDRALAQHAVMTLRDAAGGATPAGTTGIRAAMRCESLDIEKEANALIPLQTAAPRSAPAFQEALDARTAALDARAERAIRLAAVAKTVLATAPASRIVAFKGTTWENRDIDRQVPESVSIPLRIARRCVAGEHEPVSIKILNLTGEVSTVSARATVSSGGPNATVFEVKGVPSNQNVTAWDPIVPLESRTITIPGFETREIWLDLDLTDVTPGRYTVTVAIGGRRPETTAEISLDVLPFQMAGFGAMRLCNWATYSDHAIADLLAHGNNVFVVGIPVATITEGTPARITLDYTVQDRLISKVAGHDVVLLMSGVPSLGVPVDDAAYGPRFADYIGQMFAHFSERGVDEEHIAFYPYDEPGGAGWNTVNAYIAFARKALAVRPGLKFYVNA